MEKSPLGERPFEAKHERARCGEAQQSLRRGWKGRRAACAEPQEQKFQQSCSAPRSAQPRWGLCSGLAGAHLLVCCVHLGWLCVSRCECFPLHLDHGMVAVSSMPHHPCCSEMEERDPQKVYKIFNSLWSPKASVNEKISYAWKEQSIKASARHRTGKWKH